MLPPASTMTSNVPSTPSLRDGSQVGQPTSDEQPANQPGSTIMPHSL